MKPLKTFCYYLCWLFAFTGLSYYFKVFGEATVPQIVLYAQFLLIVVVFSRIIWDILSLLLKDVGNR